MPACWNRNLRCRCANRAYERWFGVSAGAVVGTTLPELPGPALPALNAPHIEAKPRCAARRGEAKYRLLAESSPLGRYGADDLGR
jgi:PAS domain-containing protein